MHFKLQKDPSFPLHWSEAWISLYWASFETSISWSPKTESVYSYSNSISNENISIRAVKIVCAMMCSTAGCWLLATWSHVARHGQKLFKSLKCLCHFSVKVLKYTAAAEESWELDRRRREKSTKDTSFKMLHRSWLIHFNVLHLTVVFGSIVSA